MAADLRIALRALGANPVFSVTVVAVLALGIGANSAIFGLINQTLLAPPGVSDPSRVVAVRAMYAKLNLASIGLSGPDFRDVKASRDVFEHTAAMEPAELIYSGAGESKILQAAKVSLEWFDVFKVRPALGRAFVAEEDLPNATPVVVLSHAAWVRIFGGDASVVGRTVTLDERSTKIVGVMPEGFRWPQEVDAWVPLALPAAEFTEDYRFNEHLFAVARSRPGVSLATADARVRTVADRLKGGTDENAAFAKGSRWGMFAIAFTDFTAGDTRQPMLVLLGAVGFVLLIACANIAGLMLARTTGRSREIAVRVALGAGRWQLLRHTVAECLVLSIAGTALGILLASIVMRVLLAVAPKGSVVGLQASVDLRVLGFAAVTAVVAAFLFALAPAWQVTQVAAAEQLKGSSRTSTGGRGRLRSVLVVAETSLAMILLVGAALLIRSLIQIQHIDPGFVTRGVVLGGVSLPEKRYAAPEERAAFFRALIDRIRQSPSVLTAGAGTPLPFNSGDSSSSFSIEGETRPPGDPGPHGRTRVVSPEYFTALGIPVRTGRVFTDDDRIGTEFVTVIDENLARRYWPGQDPIGRRIRNGEKWMTIVGVVGHVLHSTLVGETDKGTFYQCLYQRPRLGAWLVVRLKDGAPESTAIVESAVRGLAPTLAVQRAATMSERVNESLAPRRFVVRVLIAFALVALLMAALGLYGVVSYAVARRTQEIGLRMALGADRASVLKLVLGQGLGLAGAGIAAGAAGAAVISALLANQLYHVSPFDPVTFGGMIVVLMATAALATYIPARTASRIEPLVALRYE
ncbi:MAG TPA: ABC transporter permease [Vicinamibacterales bacterium]|jgi:predicted permease